MQALSPRSDGPRRYLVADEVGLGKTVVARAVIAQLQALCPDRRLNVLYITSGQAIAGQNRLVARALDGHGNPAVYVAQQQDPG